MTRVACLGLLLAPFLLAGCGDVLGKPKLRPPAKTLSHAQLVRRGNRACARALRRLPKVKPGESFETLSRELKTVVHVDERLLFVLRGLPPSPADAVAYRRLLAAFNYYDLVANHFVGAFEAGQVRKLKTLGRRLDSIGKTLNKRARKLGLTTCAEG